MNVIDHYKWRYATKKFDAKKKISDSNIELIKDSISLAPTSYGLQLFKTIIVEKKEIKDDLKRHLLTNLKFLMHLIFLFFVIVLK